MNGFPFGFPVRRFTPSLPPPGSAQGDPRNPHPANPNVDLWGRPITPGAGWGFGNPEWEALYKGQATIEVVPKTTPSEPSWWGHQLDRSLGREPLTHEDVRLVPKSVYEASTRSAEVPTQDIGMTVYTGISETGNPGRQAWRVAKSMLAYVAVPSPDITNSLAEVDVVNFQSILSVPPVQAVASDPPVGGAISIARLSFGHLGVQQDALFDVPPAQIVRVPFGGSFGQIHSLLVPKYFPTDDTGLTRVYKLTPAGPQLTTALWNTLGAQVLLANAVGGLTAVVGGVQTLNPNKVPFAAYIAESGIPNQSLSQPIRRFYGSIKVKNGTPNLLDTIMPVAWYASQVTLFGDPSLRFFVQTLTTTSGVQEFGPFPFNAPITMPAGATALRINDSTGTIGPVGATIESLFEADFALSF